MDDLQGFERAIRRSVVMMLVGLASFVGLAALDLVLGALGRSVSVRVSVAELALSAVLLVLGGVGAARECSLRKSAVARLRDQAAAAPVLTESPAARRRRVASLLRAGAGVRMAFQPIEHLPSRSISGYEALSRFDDGRAPDSWFAEARELGLVVELELATIGQAIREFAGPGYLSVNVSPETLTSPELLRALDEMTERPPLVLELTEHAVVNDYDEVEQATRQLRRRSIGLAVDDVGAGVSSMHHVLSLTPHVVKLDRNLIADIDAVPPKQALVRSLVDFAQSIGTRLVAEGIETEAELAACLAIGVPYGQGYLLARPAFGADLRWGTSIDLR